MKHLMITLAVTSMLGTAAVYAQDATGYTETSYEMMDRKIQLGADLVLPYRVDDPSGRSATLLGVHAEYFLAPEWSLGLEGIIGVEDEGFQDVPFYLAPGFGFYPTPGRTFEPYIRADVPFLLNNDHDFGVRGGLGVLWNLGLAGLGLRYSFDAAYYFDAEATVLNLAHVSAVFNW